MTAQGDDHQPLLRNSIRRKPLPCHPTVSDSPDTTPSERARQENTFFSTGCYGLGAELDATEREGLIDGTRTTAPVHKEATEELTFLKDNDTSYGDSWRPRWLRISMLACFAGLFLCVTIALSLLLWYSQRNNGLFRNRDNFGYVWRFGPTAGENPETKIKPSASQTLTFISTVLTIISALWARVEFQIMRYTPWIALRCEQSPDKDLDYLSMLPPVALVQSLRRKHYSVFSIIAASFIIKSEIVLAPGLFTTSSIQITEPTDIKILDSFNHSYVFEPNPDIDPEPAAYYAALAIKDFDTPPPFGLTEDGAHQKFQKADTGHRATPNSPVKAVVEGFFAEAECAKLESYTTKVDIDEDGHWIMFTIDLFFDGCIGPVAWQESIYPKTDRQRPYVESWSIDSSSSQLDDTSCPNLPQEWGYFRYVANRFRFSDTNSSVEHVSAAAVVCSARGWFSMAEVVDDGVGTNLTSVSNGSSVPLLADVWLIVGYATELGNTNPPLITPDDIEEAFENMTSVRNITTTIERTNRMYHSVLNLTKRLSPFIGHYLLRQNVMKVDDTVLGETSTVVVKLSVSQQVCLPLILLSALVTTCLGYVLLDTERHTILWSRDPATVFGSMLFLHSRSCLRPNLDSIDAKESWGNQKTSCPLVLATWPRTTFTVFVCVLVATLSAMLRSSMAHGGLMTVKEEGYSYLLWTALPAILMVAVALYASACDAAYRGLHTIYTLSARPCSSQQFDLSIQDILGLRSLLKSLRHRIWTTAMSQIAVLGCGFLATLAAVLFSVETVPNETPVQIQQNSWFGDKAFENDIEVYQNHRSFLQSVLDSWGQVNLTYPKNTFGEFVFPALKIPELPIDGATENITIRVSTPAAKLVSNCEILTEEDIHLNISEGDRSNNLPEGHPNRIWAHASFPVTCPNGTASTYDTQELIAWTWSQHDFPQGYFAGTFESADNPIDKADTCNVEVEDNNDLLVPWQVKTYVWGSWDYDKSYRVHKDRLSFFRCWRCNYTWAQVMVDVHLKYVKGEFLINHITPPDSSTTQPWNPPFAIPLQNTYLSNMGRTGEVYPTNRYTNKAGNMYDYFPSLFGPQRKYPLEILGDPESDDIILEELRAAFSFTSAQLANLEHRLRIGEDSYSTAFPAEGLPPIEAAIIDGGRRRLVQSPPITYVIIGILSFIIMINVWALVSDTLRWMGIRSGLFSMDVKGLAPEGFSSIAMVTSLLYESNAGRHIPEAAERLSTSELHGLLAGKKFRLGWFRRESDQTSHFTIGVMDDEGFSFMGSELDLKTGHKMPHERVLNTSQETSDEDRAADAAR